jgi:hypothetical protein
MYLLSEILIFAPTLLQADPGLIAAWALEEISKKITTTKESPLLNEIL